MMKIMMLLAVATLAFGQTPRNTQTVQGQNQNRTEQGTGSQANVQSGSAGSAASNSSNAVPTLEEQIAAAEKEEREARAALNKAETEYGKKLKESRPGGAPPFSPDMERVRWTEASRLLFTLQSQQLKQKNEKYWSDLAAKLKELEMRRKEADAKFCAASALALNEPETTDNQREALVNLRHMMCDKK